jgi:hypothetical protein
MAATIAEADTSQGVKKFILISELAAPDLSLELDGFVREFRRAAQKVSDERTQERKAIGTSATAVSPSSRSRMLTALRTYFDEFEGGSLIKARSATVSNTTHGRVVRALRDKIIAELCGEEDILKSQANDLVAIVGKTAYLFEVKTSSRSQSLFTGIGQLFFHAAHVAACLPGKKVSKVLVLPERPSEPKVEAVIEELGITIMTYEQSKAFVASIPNLQALRT